MNNNINASKRIITIAIIIPILWVLFSYFFIQDRVQDLTTQKYKQISKEMTNELETLIKIKTEAVLILALSISNNNQIKEALLHKEANISLSDFSLSLRKNTSLKNIWFQVVSSKGMSRYRSWTEKSGDDLKKIRLDVVQMIKEPKIYSSISTGKFDLTFKSMVPIFHENKFIGSVEVLAKFNSIAIKMEEKEYDMIALVDKLYKQQLTKAFTNNFINDYYIANLNAKPKLISLIKDKNVSHFLGTETFHTCTNANKLVVTYHLKDIHNQEMAYFVLFHDIKSIDMTSIVQVRDRLILLFTIILALLMGFSYYFYSTKYKKFINNLNIKLGNEVTRKTKELQEQTDKLEYIANHDSLTKLPNRLLFLDRLKQSIKHAKRDKTNISVLFLDLDRFKEVNDTYGHGVGDILLQKVSLTLQESVREMDTISRLGGDEFTIIIEDINENGIIKITKKIIASMQEKFIINNTDIYTTFSIGISNYPQDGDTPDILIRNADTAMYKAKDLGKNQYQFYNQEMTKNAIEKSKIENNIRLALENDEFQPYFQPKIDALTNKVIGMEALVRWHQPEKGIISPAAFLPIAEETGLIIKIDKMMMRKSLALVKEWHDKGLHTGRLSLNLSIKQLENKDFLDNLHKCLDYSTLDTQHLEVEVTEGHIMTNPEESIKILQEVRNLGIHISVDDFGTGYSSLAYLKLLPINTLKIDHSFIDDLPHDKDDSAISKAIISLAKNLNLKVIAEGVETQEQLDFLIKEGCSHIQGYFYSKPLQAQDFEEFLKAHQ